MRENDHVRADFPECHRAGFGQRQPQSSLGQGGPGRNGQANRSGVIDHNGRQESLTSPPKIRGAVDHDHQAMPANAEQEEPGQIEERTQCQEPRIGIAQGIEDLARHRPCATG